MIDVGLYFNSQSISAVPAYITPPTTSDIVSTRQTANAATAPLADTEIADNTHADTSVTTSTQAETNNVASTYGTSGSITTNLSSTGPSSSFLAQLYGQQEDTTPSDAETLGEYFTSSPVFSKLVGYSYIKYKPSDAGIPQVQTTPAPAVNKQLAYVRPVTTEEAVPAKQVAANNNEQSIVPATTSAATQNEPVAANDSSTVANSNVPSTNVVSEYQNYSDTESRNQNNLSISQPLLVV